MRKSGGIAGSGASLESMSNHRAALPLSAFNGTWQSFINCIRIAGEKHPPLLLDALLPGRR